MKPKNYDFSGFVTKNDIRCSDGLIIRQDAFKHDDNRVVPLVWQHNSGDPGNLIGYVTLENRPEGVYGYASFNDSANAANVKGLVQHSAINAFSIYANKLGKMGKDVVSGVIREVSLVLSGANPGALIDTMSFSHGEFEDDIVDEAYIYTGEAFELFHSDDTIIPDIPEEVIVHAETSPATPPADPAAPADPASPADPEETVGQVLDTLSDKQKAAVGLLLEELDAEKTPPADGAVAHEDDTDTPDAVHSDKENGPMKKNVFDANGNDSDETHATLTHEDFVAIMESAKKKGSFRDAFIQHMEESGFELQHAGVDYGLTNIGVLFPDARSVTPTPELVKRDTGWVAGVMSATKHSPFSRIKSLSADITEDEARAKGYVTGALKINEVFALLSRSTEPTTIYKKQKMDRDDVLDITDFDVIVWLRSEMRLMLDEEIARAILIGDGRAAVSPDKIKEDRLRPVYTDDELYATHVEILETTPDKQIDEIVRAMRKYKGSGNPTLYTSPEVVTDLLLVKDTLGRRLYKDLSELASALRVKEIVEVEPMTGIEGSVNKRPLFGIIVNLTDYTVGSDKGGEVSAFDDFDINYNQLHYLIETRISGALTKPKSAIVLELHDAGEVG